MLLRRIARSLLAVPFVYDGIQAALHPADHAEVARAGTDMVTKAVGVEPLNDTQVNLVVRAHGAATALVGVALGAGVFPRTASLALAALTAPLAVVNQPFTSTGATRREKLPRFVAKTGLVGAALIAGADYEGRPGLAWRYSHARADAAKAASQAARKAEKVAREIAAA